MVQSGKEPKDDIFWEVSAMKPVHGFEEAYVILQQINFVSIFVPYEIYLIS
jgi:hypothetical protein